MGITPEAKPVEVNAKTVLHLWYMCFVLEFVLFWIATYLVLLLVDFYFSCGYDVDHITSEWG